MSEVSVSHAEARAKLDAAWGKIDREMEPPAAVLAQIKQVMLARDVAFKYIMVTGFLGKLTNTDAHPTALQAQSELTGAYDARSLSHKVIVPFEKGTKLNQVGKSNEPLVGKPARHPAHAKANTQLKNKRLAAVLHDVLEVARTATPAEVEAMLVATLRVGRERGNTLIVATPDLGTNRGHVLDFVQEFLKEGDAGARLVAVTGAFLSLLSESHSVKVYQSNGASLTEGAGSQAQAGAQGGSPGASRE